MLISRFNTRFFCGAALAARSRSFSWASDTESERERDRIKACVSDFDFVIVVLDDVDSAGDGKRDEEGTRAPEGFLDGLSSGSGETWREVDAFDASSENRELGNTLERRRAQASGS
jgi:hypothetical protein